MGGTPGVTGVMLCVWSENEKEDEGRDTGRYGLRDVLVQLNPR